MDQPTGTTGVSVSKEEAAEAQEEAQEEAEMSLIDQVMSLGHQSQINDVIATSTKILKSGGFKSMGADERKELMRLRIEELNPLVKQFNDARDNDDKPALKRVHAQILPIAHKIMTLMQKVAQHEKATLAVETDQTVPNKEDYGVVDDPVDSKPAQAKASGGQAGGRPPVDKQQFSKLKRELAVAEAEASAWLEKEQKGKDFQKTPDDPGIVPPDRLEMPQITFPKRGPGVPDGGWTDQAKAFQVKIKTAQWKKKVAKYEKLYNAYVAKVNEVARFTGERPEQWGVQQDAPKRSKPKPKPKFSYEDAAGPTYEQKELVDLTQDVPGSEASSAINLFSDTEDEVEEEERWEVPKRYTDHQAEKVIRYEKGASRHLRQGETYEMLPPGTRIDVQRTMMNIERALDDAGLRAVKMEMKQRTGSSRKYHFHEEFGIMAFTRQTSPPNKLDAALPTRYEEIRRGYDPRRYGKSQPMPSIYQLAMYSVPKRYTPQPREGLPKELTGFSYSQLDALALLFDEATGLMHSAKGGKDAFRHPKGNKTGASNMANLRKIARELGPSITNRALKGMSFAELDLIRRQIAKPLYPLLKELAGGKPIQHAIMKLKHYNHRQHVGDESTVMPSEDEREPPSTPLKKPKVKRQSIHSVLHPDTGVEHEKMDTHDPVAATQIMEAILSNPSLLDEVAGVPDEKAPEKPKKSEKSEKAAATQELRMLRKKQEELINELPEGWMESINPSRTLIDKAGKSLGKIQDLIEERLQEDQRITARIKEIEDKYFGGKDPGFEKMGKSIEVPDDYYWTSESEDPEDDPPETLGEGKKGKTKKQKLAKKSTQLKGSSLYGDITPRGGSVASDFTDTEQLERLVGKAAEEEGMKRASMLGLGRTDSGDSAFSVPVRKKPKRPRAPSPQGLPPVPAFSGDAPPRPMFRPKPVRPAGAKRTRFGTIKSEIFSPRSIEEISFGSLPSFMGSDLSVSAMNRLRKHNLSVETVFKGAERNTSYTHLIDGDLAPVGRVHLVKMGNAVGDQRDNHILTQMDADANMGAKTLLQRSKRGPFKRSSGRSRIMAKTAHVSYRRRNGALEITVRRGITESEMDTLIAKLGAHRLSTGTSFLYIIKGGSKKLISRLSSIKLEKLREQIHECLDKYSSIGLLVQDTYRKGALHKGYSHGMEMEEALRKMPGLKASN